MRAAAPGRLPAPAAILLAVAAGLLMPVQGRINGALGTQLGDPLAAATVSFGGGLALLAAFSALAPSGRAGLRAMAASLRRRDFPRWYLLAGVGGAYLVFGQATAVPLVGVALFTVAIVAGQTASGLLVDRVGFGPGGRRPVSARRLGGAALMVAAVGWSVSPRLEAGGADWLPVLLPATAGLLMGFQQAMNGTQTAHYGTPVTATLVNFGAGFAVLSAAWGAQLLLGAAPGTPPGQWWLYTGGVFGCLFIAVGAVVVRGLGVLVSGLCMVAGQLVGSLALDVLVPAPGTVVAPATIAGTALTLAAVAVAALPGRR